MTKENDDIQSAVVADRLADIRAANAKRDDDELLLTIFGTVDRDKIVGTDLVRTLARLVRRAYDEGFTEGMKEDRNGGLTWRDNPRSRQNLENLVGKEMTPL